MNNRDKSGLFRLCLPVASSPSSVSRQNIYRNTQSSPQSNADRDEKAGCVRFYYVRQLAHEPELYRQLADSLIWYALELHIAIFCGCSSALKVFFKRYFPSLLGSSSSRTKYPLDSQGNDRTKTTNSHPLASLSSRITGNQTIITATGRRGRPQIQESIGSSNSSEEAIMPNHSGIRMKTEFQQEVTRTSGDSNYKSSGTDKKAVSHVRSFVR